MNVIFDLDGTLIDSAPDIRATANLLLAEAGLPPLDLATIRGFIGNGTAVLVERVMARVGADPQWHAVWHDRFLALYDRQMLQDPAPWPGVAQALARLIDTGARLAVCTNKPAAPARAMLEAAGLMPMVSALVGGDTLPQRKPAPEPLWHNARLLGEGPVVFVGDSEVDAKAAANAGLTFLLYTQGYRQAALTAIRHDAAFGHFAALPDLVAGFAAERHSA